MSGNSNESTPRSSDINAKHTASKNHGMVKSLYNPLLLIIVLFIHVLLCLFLR